MVQRCMMQARPRQALGSRTTPPNKHHRGKHLGVRLRFCWRHTRPSWADRWCQRCACYRSLESRFHLVMTGDGLTIVGGSPNRPSLLLYLLPITQLYDRFFALLEAACYYCTATALLSPPVICGLLPESEAVLWSWRGGGIGRRLCS